MPAGELVLGLLDGVLWADRVVPLEPALAVLSFTAPLVLAMGPGNSRWTWRGARSG